MSRWGWNVSVRYISLKITLSNGEWFEKKLTKDSFLCFAGTLF